MYRVRESKSKLELFYRMFIKLSCHIFLALGLNTCLNEIWNYLYIYQRDLTPFKGWSGFRSGAGQKTLEIFVYASSNEKWRHLRSKLGFLARFTKQENGISIIQDLHVFVNHQFRFIL